MPHSLQAKRWLYSVSLAGSSPLPSTATLATSLPYLNATPSESARRASMPGRITSRSTSTDGCCACARQRCPPPGRAIAVDAAATKPALQLGQLLAVLAFAPAYHRRQNVHAAALGQPPSSRRSVTVTGAIARPQREQYGVPMAQNNSRR
jgi:hypothetical protein